LRWLGVRYAFSVIDIPEYITSPSRIFSPILFFPPQFLQLYIPHFYLISTPTFCILQCCISFSFEVVWLDFRPFLCGLTSLGALFVFFLFPMGLDVMLVVVIQLILVYILSLFCSQPGLYFYTQGTHLHLEKPPS